MNIEIRECDDWIAVYKDGKRVLNEHSVSPKMLLESLGIAAKFIYYEEDDFKDDLLGENLKDGSDPFPEELPNHRELAPYDSSRPCSYCGWHDSDGGCNCG